MKTTLLFGTLLIATLCLASVANAHMEDVQACASPEASETLIKFDACIASGNGADPISSNSFGGMAASMRTISFYQCLSRTYQTEKADPTLNIYWQDVYLQTARYFQFNLSAENGNPKVRCDFATTFNKLVKIVGPRSN